MLADGKLSSPTYLVGPSFLYSLLSTALPLSSEYLSFSLQHNNALQQAYIVIYTNLPNEFSSNTTCRCDVTHTHRGPRKITTSTTQQMARQTTVRGVANNIQDPNVKSLLAGKYLQDKDHRPLARET